MRLSAAAITGMPYQSYIGIGQGTLNFGATTAVDATEAQEYRPRSGRTVTVWGASLSSPMLFWGKPGWSWSPSPLNEPCFSTVAGRAKVIAVEAGKRCHRRMREGLSDACVRADWSTVGNSGNQDDRGPAW